MRQRGFTLIEIVVVIGLISLVLGGVLALFISNNRIYNYQTALIKASGSARTAMNAFSQDALQGYRVLASYNINGTPYNSNSSTVIFQLPAYNSSGTVISNTYDYVAYSVTGTSLKRDLQAASGSVRITSTKILSSSVSSWAVTYDNAVFSSVKKVSVDLVTSESYKSQTVTQHLAGQYKLRNY